MSSLIIDPEGWAKSGRSGNGGNCIQVKAIQRGSIAAPATTGGDGMDWSKA